MLTSGLFRRGMLLHVLTSTHEQKHLECDKSHAHTKLLTKCFLPLNYLDLIKICAHYHVIVIQTTVVDH